MRHRFKAGDRVRVLASVEEHWPEERGMVYSSDLMPWGESIILKVDDVYVEGPDDDGLRECTADQLEKLDGGDDQQPKTTLYRLIQ